MAISQIAMKNCRECEQECCRSVIVGLDRPIVKRDWEDIKWMVAHRNVYVLIDDEDDWCIEFLTDCEMLGKDGLCAIYHKKPAICTEYDHKDCYVNSEGEYFKVLFKTVDDVEKYLEEHPDAIKPTKPDKCDKCKQPIIDKNIKKTPIENDHKSNQKNDPIDIEGKEHHHDAHHKK